MKAFLSSISRNKRFVVAELFLVYFAHGLGSIMLGSVLPDLRAAYALDYQLSGTLISAQSVGYLLHRSAVRSGSRQMGSQALVSRFLLSVSRSASSCCS